MKKAIAERYRNPPLTNSGSASIERRCLEKSKNWVEQDAVLHGSQRSPSKLADANDAILNFECFDWPPPGLRVIKWAGYLDGKWALLARERTSATVHTSTQLFALPSEVSTNTRARSSRGVPSQMANKRRRGKKPRCRPPASAVKLSRAL